MDIDDATCKSPKEISFQHPHETGQNHKIHPGLLKRANELLFGNLIEFGTKPSGGDKLCRQTAQPRLLEDSRGLHITQHQNDFRR